MGLGSLLYRTLLFEKIKWCIASDPTSISHENQDCVLKLRNVIYRIQHEFDIEEKYRISESDRKLCDEIIRAYQDDLIQKYFNERALNFKLSEEDYFVVTFNSFLEYLKFEKTFENADYELICHKLFYITQLKCMQLHGKPISEGSIAYQSLLGSKEVIDKRASEESNGQT